MLTRPTRATSSTAVLPKLNMRSTGCAPASATVPWSGDWRSKSRKRTSYRRLRAGLRLFEFERGQFAGHHEVVVVERQRPRNSVLVELEANRISRCLLGAFRGFRLVEIADGNRPARDMGKLRLAAGGIVMIALVGRDLFPDHGEGVEHLVAGIGAVKDREVENGLAGARRRNRPHHVFGGKHDLGVEVESFLFRLHEIHCGCRGTVFGMTVDRIHK